jgi:hypothetical protein
MLKRPVIHYRKLVSGELEGLVKSKAKFLK